jgi:flagellar biogenesis protein FliO
MTGVLLEAPIMLIAMIISARWVIRRFDVSRALGTTISMGLAVVGILAVAEIAGVLWVSTGVEY